MLDQYCNQLSDLERAVQPVVLKTQQLIQTREKIKQARAQAEEVLDHLDASRKVTVLLIVVRPSHQQLKKSYLQVEAKILQGPHTDLVSFMAAFIKLDAAITFLQKHRCCPLLLVPADVQR